ncbi:GNAT family N-acetyltransferase [Hyphomonas sp. NPDC076900]|uniref:GNAT family N-acetyltransferase n=1 Tax=unclassified Hyphomonas TaxID=2630699 RepID=UPI003D05CA49
MLPSSHLAAVAEAYAWHRGLGNECIRGDHCQLVIDRAHPAVWSSNHASRIRAETEPEIDAVFETMDRAFAHCSHRFVSSDCFTPPQFLAHLAMRDYRELTPTLQMILPGDLASVTAPHLDLREVISDQDWRVVARLVRTDHEEGARTNRTALTDEVSRGIVEGFRKKAGPCTLYLARLDGEDCAYGMAVRCPNGLGMVEDLYTLPGYRGRGIASAIIRHCVDVLRQEDHQVIFLGAHITERPKHLYHKLGFKPLMLTREFVLAL